VERDKREGVGEEGVIREGEEGQEWEGWKAGEGGE